MMTAAWPLNEEKVMRILFVAMILFAALVTAQAQIPTRGNVFFGYSYDRTPISAFDTTNLNGWEGTLEGKFAPWIGVVVDIDGHYGSQNYSGINAGAMESPIRILHFQMAQAEAWTIALLARSQHVCKWIGSTRDFMEQDRMA